LKRPSKGRARFDTNAQKTDNPKRRAEKPSTGIARAKRKGGKIREQANHTRG
jgi:hypothetical protein